MGKSFYTPIISTILISTLMSTSTFAAISEVSVSNTKSVIVSKKFSNLMNINMIWMDGTDQIFIPKKMLIKN